MLGIKPQLTLASREEVEEETKYYKEQSLPTQLYEWEQNTKELELFGRDISIQNNRLNHEHVVQCYKAVSELHSEA